MFAEYLTSTQITFKHALGCRDVFGKEFHTFHEIFLLVGDTANFTSDHIIDQIYPNSLVIVPKRQFHQFDHIGQEENYHRYVLQFENIDGLEETIETVFDRVKLIHNLSRQSVRLFERLALLIGEQKDQADKALLLKAITTEILMDLKYNYSNRTVCQHMTDPLVQQIIDYINANFLTNITVRTIADDLRFSESYIAQKFKGAMNIPIYKYILQKKLMHAHMLICSGVRATEAASICGFSEYSGFYKMYKKYFGFSPSRAKHEV